MKLRLKQKITGLALLAAVIPMLVMSVLSLTQRKQASTLINNSIHETISEDMSNMLNDFYSLCKTANDFTQQYVNHSLNLANEKLYQRGKIKLAKQRIKWKTKNQFTGHDSVMTLPKMTYGGSWFGRNENLNSVSPVVDDVKNMLGATCTIFQRMNDRGDMLRVVTNVQTKDKKRAIGTYIPAVNPNGEQNPVISAVMNGETFRGRAYVVDDWYLTAYEPIYNERRILIGMLYVGVKQESAESFRESVLSTKVGKTGYLYAIGGSGTQKGQYIISRNSQRDGEHLWDEQDSNDDYYIRDIIIQAKSSPGGVINHKSFRPASIQNDPQPEIITFFTYFKSWDWVIGINVFTSDYQEVRENVDQVIYNLVLQTVLIGLIILAVVFLLAFILGARIASPLKQMAVASRELASGNIKQTISYSGDDEVAVLAKSFNKMAGQIHEQRSELQEANKHLEEANATKDKFFSIIAHDLKNPFNTLLTYSATLVSQFENLDKERLKQGLKTLNRNSRRGYNLLLDLLSWARSQSGNIELTLENIDLADISLENVNLLQNRAEDKEIRLFSEVSEGLAVYGDKNIVSTIIRNLLTNAVKFTAAAGEVKISAEIQDNFVKVTVSDTGIGISPENIKKLFRLDTFYRTAGTNKEKGTGLGLILCKEFVEKLNGTIWVESEFGKGSQFIFKLPVAQ